MTHEPRYPNTPGDKPVISYSSLETYNHCGLAYFLDRETSHRRSTIALLIGIVVHEVARRLAGEGGAELSLSDCADIATSTYRSERDGSEIEGTRYEMAYGETRALAASLYFASVVEDELPEAHCVEEKMIADLGFAYLVGTLDRVGGDDEIDDIKTGRARTQIAADRSVQLTAYDVLHESHFGRRARVVSLVSLYERGGSWKHDWFRSTRSDADHAAFRERVRRALWGIEQGRDVAPVAPEISWKCSPAYCPHWGHCPAVNGRRD